MSTSKGNTYLQRLEDARCNGDWDAVPEWSRKVLKHAPGRRCLAIAAQTEARIHQLLPPPAPKASPSTIVSYIVSLDALQDTLQEELTKSSLAVTKLPNPAGGGYSPVTTADDLVDTRVIVAWCSMLKGEWEDVLKALPTEREITEEWEGSGKVKEGYIHIARIKSLVLQGAYDQENVLAKKNLYKKKTCFGWMISRRFVAKQLASDREMVQTSRYDDILRAGLEAAGTFSAGYLLTKLLGIALSHTNHKDLSLPLQLYRTAIRLASTLPTAQRASPSFLEWTERALSHSALAAYRCWLENNSSTVPSPPATTCLITPRKHEKTKPEWKTDAEQVQGSAVATPDTISEETAIGTAIGKTLVDETTVSNAFKAFHTFIEDLPGQSQPTITASSQGSYPQKDEERREIYRHYFRFLSLLLLPVDHPEAPSPLSLPSGSPTDNKNGSTISVIHSSHTSPTSFTAKAGTRPQLAAELKLIQSVYEAYLTQTLPFPAASDFHELVGEFVDLVTLNWRASGGSSADAEAVVDVLYRATTKTFHSPRILRHLFYTLTSLGNLSDAVLSLETYIDLCGNAKERIVKGKIEKDFDPDATVLVTASDGIRMLCKHLSDGEKGLKIAKQVGAWIAEWRIRDTEVLASVYRGIGTANATWSRQTVLGSNEREEAQKAAEEAFKRGLECDTHNVDAWYGLALIQADLGDVDAAVESLTRGVASLGASPSPTSESYTRRAAPILHALALLLSAREEYDAATAACNTALTLLASHSEPATLSIESKEAAVQLQMTLMALTEAALGPETAVASAEILLTLYTRYFPPPLRGTPELSLNPPTTTTGTMASRPSTASRISRLFTGKSGKTYEREYSVSAYDLPNGGKGCLPAVSRPATGTARLTRPGTSRAVSGMTGSQTVRGRKEHSTSRMAPKIRVSNTDPFKLDPHSPMIPGIQPQGKKIRRFSVSGGTIRRSKSVKSSTSSSIAMGGDPTPPLPSTPGTSAGTSGVASRERSPIGSVFIPTPGGRDSPGAQGDGVMFSVLKRKLDSHQAVYRDGHFPTPPMTTPDSRSPVDSIREEEKEKDKEKEEVDGGSTPSRNDIPNNLPRSQLPYPLAPLGEKITDEETQRSMKRPWTLPEPVVRVEDERKRGEAVLRAVWLCVCALYRRCEWLGDARGALEEAMMVGRSGDGNDGHADVNVERGLLALEIGDKRAAIEFFESALSVDVDHPGAIVALSHVLLDIIPVSPAPTSSIPQKTHSDRPKLPAQLQTKEENEIDFLIRRNRALLLLRSCTSSPRGWDNAEAWYALADALERDGDVDGAKKALWTVVGLEDARGVRSLGRVVGKRIL